MNEWKVGRFTDVAEIVMGQSPQGENCNSNGNGKPLLNGPTEFGVKYPLPVQYTTDPIKCSKKNDILFCVRGSTTGRMNWADQEYVIGRGIASMRHRKGNYQDVKGFCNYARIERVKELDYVLTPGRYVGLPDEEDDFDFNERFTGLKKEFEAQLKEGEKLNVLILENLKKVRLV